MIIVDQNKKQHDVYTFETSKNIIKCTDFNDKRKKHIVGTYDTKERAVEIFKELLKYPEIYEMPIN